MNGRIDLPPPQRAPDAVTANRDYLNAETRRLTLALGCSCLLHALLLFLPPLTSVAQLGQAASPPGQPASFSFSVTLAGSLMSEAQVEPLPVASQAPSPPTPSPPGAIELEQPAARAIPPIESWPLPGSIYYPTSVLTVRPQPLGALKPDTSGMETLEKSGKLRLRLWINPAGETLKVSVEDSDLPKSFVSLAVAAFEQLRFSPGELNGEKVSAVLEIEVDYNDARVLSREMTSIPEPP